MIKECDTSSQQKSKPAQSRSIADQLRSRRRLALLIERLDHVYSAFPVFFHNRKGACLLIALHKTETTLAVIGETCLSCKETSGRLQG